MFPQDSGGQEGELLQVFPGSLRAGEEQRETRTINACRWTRRYLEGIVMTVDKSCNSCRS